MLVLQRAYKDQLMIKLIKSFMIVPIPKPVTRHKHKGLKPIPLQIRTKLHEEPKMYRCVMLDREGHVCRGKIDWHHPFQRKYCSDIVVPLDHESNLSLPKDTKEYCEWVAMQWYGLDALKQRLPKRNWEQRYNYLKQLFQSI